MTETITKVFIDESIQDEFGFIASALVFASDRLSLLVQTALRAAGLEPGHDEFKSGRRMANNPALQTLRNDLLQIARYDVRLAILFTPSNERTILGREILENLALACRRNGIEPKSIGVYFDEGIFSSLEQARRIAAGVLEFHQTELNFEQDSRRVIGIQVADVVAHTVGQVLKLNVLGIRKTIFVGEEYGYPEGTSLDFANNLLLGFREALFNRAVIYESERDSVDPVREPKIVSEEEDITNYAQYPDLFGWGVFGAARLSDEVRRAVEHCFARIWLGCSH